MRKLIPLFATALVALLVGGAGVWFVMPRLSPPPAAAAADAAAVAGHGDAHAAEPLHEEHHGFSYTVKDRVVNLADPGARRYLKVSLVLELTEPGAKRKGPPSHEEQKKFMEEFSHSRAPLVQDALTTVLTAKRSDEVALPEGREHLRDEIQAAVNRFLPKDQQVSRVLITDFIIQ
ncbi:MAG: flagellar basal body-associated FliL family protein [Chloroflexota bacterium]